MVDEQIIDIVALRKGLGWSQYRLADYLGCDQSTVSRLEAGGEISGPIRRLLLILAHPSQPASAAEATDAAGGADAAAIVASDRLPGAVQ